MRLLVCASLLFTASAARADQCMLVEPDVSTWAVKVMAKGSSIVSRREPTARTTVSADRPRTAGRQFDYRCLPSDPSPSDVTDEDDDGRFEGDDPSTMVVGTDDARHADLIASARAAKPPTTGSAPAVTPAPPATPSAVARSDVRVPARSVTGTLEVPGDDSVRPTFPLVLVVLVVLAIVGIGIAVFALR